MTPSDIPQVPTNPSNDPKPPNPVPEHKIGDTPKPREVTASKKVDDLSRHESKSSLDPREDPKRGGGDKASEPPKPLLKAPPAREPRPGAPKK
jgi:hypothetical protein